MPIWRAWPGPVLVAVEQQKSTESVLSLGGFTNQMEPVQIDKNKQPVFDTPDTLREFRAGHRAY